MTTTEDTFKLSIKETCEELRHVQSKMNDIVVRYIEDTCADDTETGDIETDNLRHDMLLALRHYQDTLFATITLLRRKYDHLSWKIQAALDRMGNTSVERQLLKEFPKVPTDSALDESKENTPYIHRSDAMNAQRSEPMIGTPLGQELPSVCDRRSETPNDKIRPMM